MLHVLKMKESNNPSGIAKRYPSPRSMAKRKAMSSVLAALLVSVGPSAVEGNKNAFFANGRRSTWTLNLQLSSTPESIGGEYRQGRQNIYGQRPPRRSANIELARRTIEELRGGGGGAGGQYDDGNYYGNYNGGGDDGDGDGGYYYDNAQQGSSPNDRDTDDYYSRGRGSYYDDDDRYREDDYGYSRNNDGAQPPSSRSRKGRSRSLSGSGGGDSSGPASFLPKVIRGGNKKYGLYCLVGGSCLTGLGMVLFFNKALIRIGNLLFVSGVPLFVGPAKTIKFFMNPEKFRATGCVLMGLFLVFVGWPIFGILLELFGLLNLFGNMFPLVKMVLGSVPGLNSLMNGGKDRQKKRRRRNDDYNDDYYGGRSSRDPYHDEQDDRGDGDGYGYGGGGYY